jgi:hypothetical protein
MKKKNKISEGALDVGIQSYQQQPTASNPTMSKNTNSDINIKKKDLNDPSVQKNLSQMKGVNVNVVDENVENIPDKLEYLSEVKDSETNSVSQPFTIGDKKYQMVRALNSKKEKVMGVYCLDEADSEGNNIIYSVDDFEKNIAKPNSSNAVTQEENVIDEPATEVNPPSKADDISPSFAGYKHYIVNKKSGKARKFKTIQELAKANMLPEEEYMGIRDFKKFVDETLFGVNKKQPVVEIDDMDSGNDEEMNLKAQKLMDIIKKRVPEQIIGTIKTPIAQREVIAAFAEMIGVPRNGLATLISGLKDLAKSNAPVTERRIIKVKDLLNE